MNHVSILTLEQTGLSLSRVEEREGWLGRERRDPGDLPDRGWHQRDEPTVAEEREATG